MRMDCTFVAELHDLAEARRVVDAFLDRCPDYTCMASLKLDGWFAEVRVLPGGAVEWTSKAGNPLRHLSALDADMRRLVELLHLPRATFDAEITHASGRVEDVAKVLNDTRGDARDLRVNLFDIRLDWFILENRAQILAQVVDRLCHPHVLAVEHAYTDDPLGLAQEIVAAGGEGLVLKNPAEPYDVFTSCGWCKVVRADTLDLPVLRVVEGRGAASGRVGAFVCAWPDGREVKVMTGAATHGQLRAWLAAPPAMIAVRANGRTRTGLPRQARFVRTREDKAVRSEFHPTHRLDMSSNRLPVCAKEIEFSDRRRPLLMSAQFMGREARP